MKRVLQLFVVATLGALLSPALANAAPRMYVGFHDDVDSQALASRPTTNKPYAAGMRPPKVRFVAAQQSHLELCCASSIVCSCCIAAMLEKRGPADDTRAQLRTVVPFAVSRGARSRLPVRCPRPGQLGCPQRSGAHQLPVCPDLGRTRIRSASGPGPALIRTTCLGLPSPTTTTIRRAGFACRLRRGGCKST